jgi:hypothetical protein
MGLLTGLAVGGLIANGVTQVIGAKKASNAAKDVAKIQTEAADKASGINDQVYSPYLRQGRSAASTMSRLTTPSAGARYASPDMTQPPAPQPGPMPGGRPRPAGAPNMGGARPRGTLGAMAQGGGAPQGGPPQGGGGQMVMMEAPDGSGARPVPADQVDRFLQAGARRVS